MWGCRKIVYFKNKYSCQKCQCKIIIKCCIIWVSYLLYEYLYSLISDGKNQFLYEFITEASPYFPPHTTSCRSLVEITLVKSWVVSRAIIYDVQPSTVSEVWLMEEFIFLYKLKVRQFKTMRQYCLERPPAVGVMYLQ